MKLPVVSLVALLALDISTGFTPISSHSLDIGRNSLPFLQTSPPLNTIIQKNHKTTIHHGHHPTPLFSSTDDDDDNFDDLAGEPSDYSPSDLAPPTKLLTVDTDEDDFLIRDELKRELLLLASVTDRGSYASREEQDIIVDLVTQLEALNPTVDPARECWGEWDLCLTDTQVFRSSPFFQAVRAMFGGEDAAIAENAFDMHEKSTSVGKVGRVRQTLTEGGEIVSKVDLEVGLFPGMPFRVKGTVVTTAQLDVVGPESWEVTVQSTTVKGSNVPFLDQFLDDYPIEVPVGDIYGMIRGEVPVAVMKTFYVDEGIRITRDVDDNIYVFSRA